MKQRIIFSFAILFSGTFFCQTPQTGTSTETTISVKETPIMYHRARIYYNGPKGILLLANQGLAVDHGHHKFGVYIESDFSENEIQKAKMLGMKVEIQIEDVKQFYVNQNKGINKSTPLKNNSGCSGPSSVSYPVPLNYNHGSMGGFLTLTELYQELDDMAALYPNLISVKAPVSTFLTHENRPIYWVRMSDNPNSDEAEPEVLYTAIHHAREPEAMQQLVYYMWYMLENYATNSEVQGILDNTELYFIPMVNPDGYQHNVDNDPNGGGMHRKNKRNVGGSNPGVDNNRNYDYIDGSGNSIWGTSGVSFNTNNDTYPGTGPFSEPENQAIKWFVENHNIKLALNNHTSGDLLLYPYGYGNNQLTPDNSTYVEISGMMVAENGYNNMISAGLYPAAGDSDDFMYGETSTHDKIFAFTPEIGGTGFWPAINEIDPIAEGMVYLNLTAAHLVTNYAQTNDLTAAIIPDLSGSFYYDIQRLGLEDPANFTVSILPISSNILTVGTPNTHNAMALLQQDNDSISYTLDPAIANGDVLTYVISVDNGQYLSNDTVTKIYGQAQIVFTEVGNNLNNWSSSASWNTTTSTFYSPSSSITDSPGGNYSNNIEKSITLTSGVSLNNAVAATLSFYGKWEIEDNYDYVQLEISTDAGANWIPQCGNYTNAGSSNQATGEPLYDGFQTSWVKEEISLSDYLGQTIMARFTIVSDNWVTEDGFYFDDFEINVVSCDSSSSTINDVFCGSYTLNGQTYTTPGTYTQTVTNVAGCNSIITLSLSLDSSSSSINDVFCGSYNLNGQTYTSPGTYTQTVANSVGCDSIITLNLSDNASASTMSQTACGSYILNGQTYTSSGTYTQTLSNAASCDSIVTLNLTIANSSSGTDVQTACNSYTWMDGVTYTSNNNTATYALTNAASCDSIVTLDLTINNVDNGTTNNSPILSANAVGANYQWLDCDNNFAEINGETDQIFTAFTSGNYAVEVEQNGCADTSACENVSNLGIAEIATNINLHPNPTPDQITIDIKGYNGPVNVEVYDLQGRLLETTTNTIVSLKKHAKGIYVLKVSYGDITEEVRVLRE